MVQGPFFRIDDDAIIGNLGGLPFCFNRIDTPQEWQELQEHLAESGEAILPKPELTDREKAEREIESLQEYLAETDWYVTRFTETGVPIPSDVSDARAQARERISTLRASINAGGPA
jgi:hypothetical protein